MPYKLIRECLTVHTVGVGHGVGVLLPNGVQIRPAVHGLAGYVAVLTLTAPELEGVAGAGRGGSVRGGKVEPKSAVVLYSRPSVLLWSFWKSLKASSLWK